MLGAFSSFSTGYGLKNKITTAMAYAHTDFCNGTTPPGCIILLTITDTGMGVHNILTETLLSLDSDFTN